MRTDNTTNLRRAKKMTIGFLSGVTEPAHEGATAKIMKFKSETMGTKLLKSVFSSALAESNLQQQVNDIISNAWPLNDALREAAEDIAKDDSITDKNAALSQAVNEYIMAMQIAAQGKLNQSMYKAKKTEDGVEFPASDYAYVPDAEKPSTWKLRLTSTPGGEPDARIVGAAVAALGKGYRGNKVEIPESDLPGVIKRVESAWLKANPEKSKDDLPDVLKKVGNNDMSELEKYKALAKMSDVHKAYHDTLPEADQEGFRVMEPTARDALIAMNQDESFTTLSGEIIHKSKAGPLFSVLKSQDAELVKARDVAKLQKARERVAADFPDLPGTADEKIAQIMALDSLPQEQRDAVEKQLTQANALWKARRNPATGLSEDMGDAKTQMAKLVNDWLAANPGKKRTDAMKAVANTPEGKKLNAQLRGGE